jgi:predicted phosphodiesterase
MWPLRGWRAGALALAFSAASIAAVLRAPSPFTVVLLPDTQYYSLRDPRIYFAQADSIVRWRDSANIKFVIHLGDVTHKYTNPEFAHEWKVADSAQGILERARIPYTIIPGNHDYPKLNDDGASLSRNLSVYNNFFPASRFSSKDWSGFGGHMAGNQENRFWLFDHEGLKFMVIGLEHAPPKDAVCWADSLAAAHPQHRIIVTTHCYQDDGGGHADCVTSYRLVGSNGGVLWDELVSRHTNMSMVLSGHINGAIRRQRAGFQGTPVQEILTDYQQEPHDDPPNGNGWLRLMRIVPESGKVHIVPRTVKRGVSQFFQTDNYSSDPDNTTNHTLHFDMDLQPLSGSQHDGSLDHFADRTVNAVSSGQQRQPTIASSPNGRWAVAWSDDQDQNGRTEILARAFKVNGCEASPVFTVNAVGAGNQRNADLAMDQAGGMVAVWEDDSNGNGVYQIKARGFNPNGSQRFAQITVNTDAAGQQLQPAVAADQRGNFVVVWADDRNANHVYQIRARAFNANGTQRLAELTVNTVSTGQQLRPDVAMAPNGNFVVVWQDDRDQNGMYQIRARGFRANGTQWLPDQTVNATSSGQQLRPAVATDAAGGFVVVWADDKNENDVYQIRARGYNANGTQRFSDRTVNDVSDGQQVRPDVSVGPGGWFVVSWTDDRNSNGFHQMRAREFAANGTPTSGDRLINSDPGGQQRAGVVGVTSSSGRYVVAWEDDLNQNDVYEILARGMTPQQSVAVRPEGEKVLGSRVQAK